MQLRDDVIGTLPAEQSASPLHPAKTEPVEGVAVSETVCPDVNVALHAAPHRTPGGLLVTMPLPLPALLTFTVLGGINVNVAMQW